MAIQLILTTTKPEDIEWWWKLYPVKQDNINKYMRSLNGFINDTSDMISDNTRVHKLTFHTQDDLSVWQTNLRIDCPESVERANYNSSNGIFTIVSTRTV